jgi:hypothetical protein
LPLFDRGGRANCDSAGATGSLGPRGWIRVLSLENDLDFQRMRGLWARKIMVREKRSEYRRGNR